MNKYDVTITGGPDDLTLVNNSDRHIIAYSVYWRWSVTGYFELVTSFLEMREGKPPLVPAHSKLALTQDSRMQVAARDGGGQNRITGAMLEAIVFDDGEVVGINAGEAELEDVFQRMDNRVRAEKDLHQKLLKTFERADQFRRQ